MSAHLSLMVSNDVEYFRMIIYRHLPLTYFFFQGWNHQQPQVIIQGPDTECLDECRGFDLSQY